MMYCLLTITSSYYRWEPVKDLTQDWYFYTDWSEEFDDVENYLKMHQHGITMLNFREVNCNYPKTEDIYGDDIYSDGILFQASEEELGHICEMFSEVDKLFVPVAELVEEECGFDKAPGVYRIIVQIIISILTIGSGVLWFWRALKKSREERAYLLYVGNDVGRLRKQYCSSFLGIFVILWSVSFIAVFLPEPSANSYKYFENSAFWRIYPPIPFIVFGICAGIMLLFFWIFRFIWKRELLNVKKYYGVDEAHMCVKDMTLRDNVKLIFWTQGFSGRMSEKYAAQVMHEKGIQYCAGRVFEKVGAEEKLRFYQLREELIKGVSM